MNVIIDLTALNDNYSGMEHYAEALVIEMLKMNDDVQIEYILVFKNEIFKSFKQFEHSPNVSMVVLEGGNKLFFSQFTLLRYLYQKKADIYFFPAFPPPLLFHKQNVYSVIFDMVCWDCPETMKFISKYYFRAGIRHAVKISRKLITISEFSKDRIISKFSKAKKKLQIVYCGVDEQYVQNKKTNTELVWKKYQLPERYILCLSTVEPRKNMRLLVEAYSELAEQLQYELVIVGRKGWKVEQLMEGIDKRALSKITFTGFVDSEDLPSIYSGAICFVFPSLYEGFGMPPLESLATGTPVLVSDIKVLKETMGNSANYFMSNQKADLKEKLFWINKNDKEKLTDKENFSECVQKYRWDKEAGKIVKMLKNEKCFK